MAALVTSHPNRLAGMVPNQDVVYEIIDHVESCRDMCALAQTCRLMHAVVSPVLLKSVTLRRGNVSRYLRDPSRFEHLRYLRFAFPVYPSMAVEGLAMLFRKAHRLIFLRVASIHVLLCPPIFDAVNASESLRELTIDDATPPWTEYLPFPTSAHAASSIARLRPPVQDLYIAYMMSSTNPTVLGTLPPAPSVHIHHFDGLLVLSLLLAFPNAHTLVIDSTSPSYTSQDLDFFRGRNINTPVPQFCAPCAIDTLKCSVRVAYALAVGQVFDVQHLSLGGCCPYAPDSNGAMNHPRNQNYIYILRGVLSCARPQELELGCWAFARYVARLAETLLPQAKTLQALRVHFKVVNGASNRCAIYALLPVVERMTALRQLHLSILTEHWDWTRPLGEQAVEHPPPREFARSSFGQLDPSMLARKFLHAAPQQIAFSVKLFDKPTIVF